MAAWVRMSAGLITSQTCSGVNSSSSASATVAGWRFSQNARSPSASFSASISRSSGPNRAWGMAMRATMRLRTGD